MSKVISGLEKIGAAAEFAVRIVRDAFRAPCELPYVIEELLDQGWRSLPLIIASGIALEMVMTLHTRTELIKFGASAWIPEVQCQSFFIEIGPLVAALLLAGRVGAGIGGALVVEGYAVSQESGGELDLSRGRAIVARNYIHERFHLDSQNIGTVSLREVPPPSTQKNSWNGISLLLLPQA